MFNHSTNTASFFSVLAALIFSLSLAGIAASQGNTSLGTGALQNNTTATLTPPSDSTRSLATLRAVHYLLTTPFQL
jgi:hypothetical protein